MVQGAQSFSRSLNVLQMIADYDGAPTIADLLSRTDLTRPTLYRILGSLEAEGLVQRQRDKSYILGIRLVSLARKALADNDLRKIARPCLEKLRDETGETVHLALRSGDELVYVDKIESTATVRMTSTIGTRVTFHSTGVGKAFLSAMEPSDADELIDRLTLSRITRYTTTDKKVLRDIVAQSRQQGFVFDDQENEEGIVCYGAAICSTGGGPVAAISVSIPTFRLQSDPDFYTAPLQKWSRQISGLLD
ncbi:MAG TPA: IclR family transcriptional regulator [Rhizobiales bacterium]|nr:IclR family transcriptional regulator [Hyphomicrobiales bacterium]